MTDLTITLKHVGEEVVIGALRRVGEVAINALGAAFSIVADFADDSFKGALEAQAGIDKFTAALKRAGENAPVTAKEAEALTQKFKNLVGGSDDMVLAMETVTLRFDKIGKEVFPRVIEQSADLATTLNMEPTAAAQLLGKTLQDLATDGTASIGRLKAAGIALTEAQEKQIATFIEQGKVTEAQTVLLDALAATTGGAAAANAETLTGKWAIFKETIADAGEGILMKFLPPLTELSDKVMPVVLPLIEKLGGAAGNFAELLATGNISGALAQIGIDFNEVKEQSQPLIDAILNLRDTFGESMPQIQGLVQFMTDFVRQKFDELSPALIENVSNTLNSIAEFWRAHGDEIMAVVAFAFQVITTTVGVALLLLSAAIKLATDVIEGDWSGAWETIKTTFVTAMDSILSIVGTDLDSFIESWRGTFELAGTIVSTVFQNIVDGIRAKVGELAAAAASAAQAAIQAIRDAFGMHSPGITFDIGQQLMSDMARGVSSMAYAPALAAVGAAQAVTYSTQATINVNGAGDPYLVAREVKRQLDAAGTAKDARTRTGG